MYTKFHAVLRTFSYFDQVFGISSHCARVSRCSDYLKQLRMIYIYFQGTEYLLKRISFVNVPSDLIESNSELQLSNFLQTELAKLFLHQQYYLSFFEDVYFYFFDVVMFFINTLLSFVGVTFICNNSHS